MPANCGACGLACSDDSEVVKCQSGCGSSIHLNCVPSKTRGAKKDWYCDSCKTDKSSLASSRIATTTSITKEFLVSTLDAFKAEMINELKTYAFDNTELRNSLQFAVGKSTNLMENIRKELKQCQEENLQLRRENAELRGSINHLEVRVRNMEQHSRKQNIEIDGLPETTNEDIKLILADVAKAINVEMKPETVVAAHRVPSFNKKRVSPIIVRFSTYEERDSWISGFRQARPITAKKINSSFSDSAKVFINEHLSPENKVLLGKTKEIAKSKGYRYVWSRDGKIFVRRGDGERCRKIDMLSDLSKL